MGFSTFLPLLDWLRLATSVGVALGLALTGAPGCREVVAPSPVRSLAVPAPGVEVLELSSGLATVRVVDVDLNAPGVSLEVAAEEIALRENCVSGRARTVADWVRLRGAAAGVNGGFFGATLGEAHKEIVGLLQLSGRVRAAAPPYRPDRERAFVRSVFGLTSEGSPSIRWAATRRGRPQELLAYPAPEVEGSGTPWRTRQALACGPRLIHQGRIAVTDREERLVSRGPLGRTFVGYGGPGRGRLALCVADGMEFQACARFLQDYFHTRMGGECREAMCLDGGSSSQAAWRTDEGVASSSPAAPTVPTAILVHAATRD